MPATKPTPAASNDELLRLDNQLCFALYSASLAVTRLYKPLLDQMGLTYPQYLVLLVLWEQDGLSVSAIGERLSLDSGTLTPLLKRLEALGLIARTRSAEDERRVDVTLTAEGRRLKSRAARLPACMREASQCSVSELVTLRNSVRALRERISGSAT